MTTPIPLTRSRRRALAIGLPFVLAAVGFGALNYVSLVGEDSYRVPPTAIPGTGTVTFGVGSGDITVSPRSDGRSEYSGMVYYSLIKPKLHWKTSSGGAFLAGGPNCFWIGNCGANLRLSVPPERPVHASSGSGDVEVSGLTGSVRVGDGSGDIVVNRLSGPLDLINSSGNIEASGLASRNVKANDDSGDVKLSFTKPPARVTVAVASGNITIVVPAGTTYYIVANVVSGSKHIEVETGPNSHHTMYLSDDSGDVNVLPAS